MLPSQHPIYHVVWLLALVLATWSVFCILTGVEQGGIRLEVEMRTPQGQYTTVRFYANVYFITYGILSLVPLMAFAYIRLCTKKIDSTEKFTCAPISALIYLGFFVYTAGGIIAPGILIEKRDEIPQEIEIMSVVVSILIGIPCYLLILLKLSLKKCPTKRCCAADHEERSTLAPTDEDEDVIVPVASHQFQHRGGPAGSTQRSSMEVLSTHTNDARSTDVPVPGNMMLEKSENPDTPAELL